MSAARSGAYASVEALPLGDGSARTLDLEFVTAGDAFAELPWTCECVVFALRSWTKRLESATAAELALSLLLSASHPAQDAQRRSPLTGAEPGVRAHATPLRWARVVVRDASGAELARAAGDADALRPLPADKNPWGVVDIVFEGGGGGLYALNIAPRSGIPLHRHLVMSESELAASHALLCGGRALPRGAVHRWGRAAHDYRNEAAAAWATVLCVDCPPFVAEDERPVAPADAAEPPQPPASFDGDALWRAWVDGEDAAAAASRPARFRFSGALHEAQRVEWRFARDADLWPRFDAAVVLAFDDERRLLLARHRRRGWELPGGKIERGEDAETAARREAREEAGCELGAMRLLGAYAVVDGEAEGSASLPPHVKAVFVARVRALRVAPLTRETSEWRAERAFADEHERFSGLPQRARADAGFSALLRDQVLPLALCAARRGRLWAADGGVARE